MKTYIKNSQHNNNTALMHKHALRTNYDKINTQTRENKNITRPAQAISFGGSAGLNLTKGAKRFFNNTVEFVNENEAAYNAIYSIIIAGILKPLFVLNMPGSEEKDKQIVATKNFLQAFLGGFLSLTIGGGFIKKSIDIVKNNLKLIDKIDDKGKIKTIDSTNEKALDLAKEAVSKEKTTIKFKFNAAKEATKDVSGFKKLKQFYKSYTKAQYSPNIDEITSKSESLINNFVVNHKKAFEKNPEFLELLKTKKDIKEFKGINTSYADAFETFWKNSTGALTAIGKAKISSLLLPGVMAFLFAKKNLEKEQQKELEIQQEKARQGALINNSAFKNEQEQFKQMMNKNNSQVSFKGGLASAIDGCATLIEEAGMSKIGANLAKFVAKFKKPSARMADFESISLTAYWVQNTIRSKKIEESQKLGLNVHTVLVTAVSSTMAFILDWALDGLIDKSKEKYQESLEKIVENIKNDTNHKNTINSMSKLKFEKATDAMNMGIKDGVSKLLEKDYDKNDVAALVEKLRNSKTFIADMPKDFNLEQSVNKAIQEMKKTESIKKDIQKACEDMIGSKDIVKKLTDPDILPDSDATKKAIESLSKKYGKKLSKFKSLTIFTLVVRFLVPVLMVPFSGKLKKKIVAWQEERNKNKNTAKI